MGWSSSKTLGISPPFYKKTVNSSNKALPGDSGDATYTEGFDIDRVDGINVSDEIRPYSISLPFLISY